MGNVHTANYSRQPRLGLRVRRICWRESQLPVGAALQKRQHGTCAHLDRSLRGALIVQLLQYA